MGRRARRDVVGEVGVLAWLFVDRERIVDSVRNQISFRTAGSTRGVSDNPLTGFTKNVSYWLDHPLTPAGSGGRCRPLAMSFWRAATAATSSNQCGGSAPLAAVIAFP